jgi:hypothetical protein
VKRVLERIFRTAKPEVLDLGPLCGDTVIYLADRGARVSVEEFRPPLPTPAPRPGQKRKDVKVEPFRIEQPTERFDLVLAWENTDFIPPDRLPDFGAEVGRILADQGWLLLYSLNSLGEDTPRTGSPSRYRLVGNDQLVREPTQGSDRPRWVYPTREIERALAPLSIQGIQLQRNQIREFVALKGRLTP